MIKYIPYSMYDAFDDPNIQAMVNTINCVGIMGKGLALEFKIRYPEMADDYLIRFKNQQLEIGKPYIYKANDKWIINFPTKNHWALPSKLEYIDKGMRYFAEKIDNWSIKSIAFPRLGCTSGGLLWEQVKPVMEKYLSDIKDIDIYIFIDKNSSEKEKAFIDFIHVADENVLKKNFKLSEKQIRSLKHHINTKGKLVRVRELLNVRGIGEKAYKKIIDKRNQSGKNQQEFLFE